MFLVRKAACHISYCDHSFSVLHLSNGGETCPHGPSYPQYTNAGNNSVFLEKSPVSHIISLSKHFFNSEVRKLSASFHRPQPASHHSPGQLSPFLILKHVLNAQQKCWRCSSAKVKIILGLFCFPYHLYRKYLCVGEEKIVFDVWPQLYC